MKKYTSTLIMVLVSTVTIAQQAVQKTAVKTGGGAASASYAATGKAVSTGDTTKAGRQTQGATFGEKVNQGVATAARPGSPIGRIVVKGGKNPGGSQMVVTSDNGGQFEVTIKEAGNYRFVLTAPENTTPQGKSISEKGGKRAESPLYTGSTQTAESPLYNPGALAARPGSPIGGIIVKGGKNPGGSMMVLTTNNEGELVLNGLQPGNYRFTVTAPANGQAAVAAPKAAENERPDHAFIFPE